MPPPVCAWIGLGAMGKHLAAHVHRASAAAGAGACAVFNRDLEVGARHAARHGTNHCSSLEEVARAGPRLLFTCLPTSSEVEEVARAIGPMLGRGAMLVDCTSGNPRQTREIGAFLEGHGVGMVDAPLSGGPAGAEAGTLSVIVGGEEAAVAEVTPLLDSFAKAVTHVGSLGSGHAVKAVNNTLNSAHLLLAAEGVACLTAQGIDPRVALDAINQSSGRSLQTEVRMIEEVLSRRFKYNFKLGLMRKDVGIGAEMCADYFPGAELMLHVQQVVNAAEDKYGGAADYTYLARLVEERAGVEMKGPTK